MAGTGKRIRIAVAVLALAGLAIMSYLTYIHYANKSSFCDISKNVSCDVVTTSVYSEIFGVPMSLLGLGYFLSALLLLGRKRGNAWLILFFLTLFVLIPSLYLSSLELFVIEALCILCETSKVLMLAILFLSYRAARSRERITARMAMPIIIAGIAATAITYFAQTGNVVKKDYSELVSCLNERGVVYYKSFRCSSCKRQERLLGDAYLKLNAVECHPEGPNGKPELCLAKKISKTPTFILEPGGVEEKRAEGIQQLDELAAFAGCPFEP